MSCTKAARLWPFALACASITAQNSLSSATLVRWPEREKERFFNTECHPPVRFAHSAEDDTLRVSFRRDHVFRPHHGIVLFRRDIAALDRLFLQRGAVLVRGLGDL